MSFQAGLRDRAIVLIGFRGVGKSQVGSCLASRLGIQFVDTDDEIERAAGRSIAAIFADSGESHFRELEAATVAQALSQPGRVVSIGGGAVLRGDTRKLVRERAICIWLTAPEAEISRRLATDSRSARTRPRLTDLSTEAEIGHLLEQRSPLYAEIAHATVDTAGRTIDDVCDEVLAAIGG